MEERKMKREQLTALGLTDEQIETIMAENSKDIQNANKKTRKYEEEIETLREKATLVEELQSKIEEAEQGKMTELEKLTKELEKSNNRVAELERIGAIRDQRSSACEKFKITAEEASKVVRDDGTLDYDFLGQIMEEKQTNAVAEYEKKKLAETQNPNGRTGGDNANSFANELAINSAKRAKSANENILANYRR